MSIIDELRRDPESGARLLEGEYKAGLTTLARRFCTDEGDAEELVNRTFAAVVAGIDDYVEQSAFFAWMCQILAHLHSMIRRFSVDAAARPVLAFSSVPPARLSRPAGNGVPSR